MTTPPPIPGYLPSPFATLSGRVVITACHSLAISSTIYRILYRLRINRFAWDDVWATLALLLDALLLICTWLQLLKRPPASSTDISSFYLLLKILFWLISASYNAVVWTSRISLVCSIARFLSPGKLKMFCTFLSAIFIAQCAIVIIIRATLCDVDFSRFFVIMCRSLAAGRSVAIYGVTMDILACLILVFLPTHVLWRMNLSRKDRRLVMSLFAATIITLCPSIVNAYYALMFNALASAYSSQIEAAVSLMVCNLVIVVTSIYKFIHRDRGEDSDDSAGNGTSNPFIGVTHATPTLDTTTIDTNRFSITDLYSLGSDLADTTPGDSTTFERSQVAEKV